jgi:hypothetical protein
VTDSRVARTSVTTCQVGLQSWISPNCWCVSHSSVIVINARTQETSDNIIHVHGDVVRASAGSVLSEAVHAMFDDVVLNKLAGGENGNLDGSGITMGFLSDSFNCLGGMDDDIASGDLPVSTLVLVEAADCGAGTDEGRALAQVSYDMAPGVSTMYFCSAFNGFVQFAQCIDLLREVGCDIIDDDVSYFQEAIYQDDIIAQAVDRAAANGVAYFTSAGNNGERTHCVLVSEFQPHRVACGVWAGVCVCVLTLLCAGREAYEARFRGITASPFGVNGTWHDFSGTGDVLQVCTCCVVFVV